MTDPHPADSGQRYDRLATGYADWWGPVIAPSALTVLDAVADVAGGTGTRILDLGTGTGTLALAAARRWPAARVVGADPSDGMLEIARASADRGSGRPAEFVRAFADALPFADGSFDVVVSSFVLQLVPNRFRALREARRVLRPGGSIAFVTWLAGSDEDPFEPDAVVDEVLDAFDLDGPGEDPDPRDIPSAEAIVDEVRRAGFRRVRASVGGLRHQYSAEEYVGFIEEFDEDDLFRSFDEGLYERVHRELLERMRALRPDELVLNLPTVLVSGERG